MAKATKKKNKEESKDSAFPNSIKKFRQLPEIEGFYRFIYENDLRHETIAIIKKIILARKDASKAAAK